MVSMLRFIHEQLKIQPQTKDTLEQYTREFEKLFKSASDKIFIYETLKLSVTRLGNCTIGLNHTIATRPII